MSVEFTEISSSIWCLGIRDVGRNMDNFANLSPGGEKRYN